MARIRIEPELARAINRQLATPLGRKYNRWAGRTYGLRGKQVVGRTTAAEFAGRSTRTGRGVVSSAGARGPAQFIPSTREAFIEQYGVDPWKNDDQAIRGMMLHHLNSGGIAGYNPGMPSYTSLVLGQRVTGIAGTGGGRGGSGGRTYGGGGGAVSVTGPSVSRDRVEPGGAGLAGVLMAMRGQERQVPSSSMGVRPPSFSARPALPSGYQPVSSGAPAPKGPSLDEMLQAVQGLQGAPPPRSTVTPGSVSGGRQGGGRGALRGSGELRSGQDGWYGTKTVAQPAYEIAEGMGISASSEKRSTKHTSSGSVSDHWEGNRHAWAVDWDTPGIDTATGHKLARRIAKRYGVKYVPNSYESGGTVKVDGRTFRIQILYGSGVDHGDHVHVGWERVI